MLRLFFAALILMAPLHVNGQTEVRPLPININRPSMNLFAPYISGDGETLVYLSDYADDGHHTMYWTTRKGISEWHDGREINKLVNRPTLNFRGGYSLSFDGDILYFTSRKTGIGGFDIWYSRRSGNDWTAPKNLGKPVNSALHDGSPSITPDGDYLYFMRCQSMSEYGGAEDCKLMVSKRSVRGWSDPEELPSNVNTGNSQSPRILADKRTLIFSSDKMGGMGELDLFVTKQTESGWSDPIPLAYINTPYKDAFVSVTAKGRYLLASVKGSRDFQLVEQLIPENLQPARVMRIKGTVTQKNGPVKDAAFVVFDLKKRSRLYQEEINSQGEFSFVLPEGSDYDVSFTSSDPELLFYSKAYHLTTIGRKDKEVLNVVLPSLEKGQVLSTSMQFVKHDTILDAASDFEIRRLARLASEHPELKMNIEVIQSNYREDSIASDPDLTELRIDTLWTPPVDTLINPLMVDTLTLSQITLDSTFFVSTTDSSIFAFPKQFVTLKKTYHNNRTEKQAAALVEALIQKGVNKENLIVICVIRKDEILSESEDEENDDGPPQVVITVM